MRLIDMSNGQTVNADRIVRIQYLDGQCAELKVWLAGHPEPIVRTGEMARKVHDAIRDAETQWSAMTQAIRENSQLVDVLYRRMDEIEEAVAARTGPSSQSSGPPPSQVSDRANPELLHGRSTPALVASIARHAREADEEADELATGGDADLGTANLLRVCAAHMRESLRRLVTMEGVPTEPSVPGLPRRYRWPKDGNGNGYHHGCYFPGQDRSESEVSGHPGKPAMEGLEWIDPKPEVPS